MQAVDVVVDTSNLSAESQETDRQELLRYEEMFRVIGQLLDTEGWCNVCLRESGSGIQIMAQRADDLDGPPVAFALHRGKLRVMVRQAQARRSPSRATMLLAAADAAKRV